MTKPNSKDLRDIFTEALQTETPGAMVVNYHLVVECVSPDHEDPWLRVLNPPRQTPWSRIGLAKAGMQISESMLYAGWSTEDPDEHS